MEELKRGGRRSFHKVGVLQMEFHVVGAYPYGTPLMKALACENKATDIQPRLEAHGG